MGAVDVEHVANKGGVAAVVDREDLDLRALVTHGGAGESAGMATRYVCVVTNCPAGSCCTSLVGCAWTLHPPS